MTAQPLPSNPAQARDDQHFHCANGCEKAMGTEVDGVIVCAKCGDDWVECSPEICG